MSKFQRNVFLYFLVLASSLAYANDFTEHNRKIAYMRETGSGPDQKHAALKLNNIEALEAGCFEDVILLDVSSADGKAMLGKLMALYQSQASIKAITFSMDEEGDCRLTGLEQ